MEKYRVIQKSGYREILNIEFSEILTLLSLNNVTNFFCDKSHSSYAFQIGKLLKLFCLIFPWIFSGWEQPSQGN